MPQDSIKEELIGLLRDSREQARFLGELGVENIALGSSSALNPAAPPANTSAAGATARTPPSANPRPASEVLRRQTGPASPPSADSLFNVAAATAPSLAKSNETLEQIWTDIGECTRCGLCEGRTQVVNTHGNRNARLMFVGEAPGADEDAQGKPFVGRAGQLLTKMIEAMGLKRENVIIGNVNRCRPPGNRQPTLEEAAICRPFLFREIGAIQPEVIVVMGNTALRNLLEEREGISRVRGKFRDFRGIKVMPTFHPAYLLRDPSKKRETWEDLKMVRDFLESAPGRQD
ncbi:MAG TPA: uracil-DNA glycosylase family protein [Pyrinomonadaceae bacterium]|nr:uracil-DNA glycosylase family protein [Pyrinomonadaceae bacterium]